MICWNVILTVDSVTAMIDYVRAAWIEVGDLNFAAQHQLYIMCSGSSRSTTEKVLEKIDGVIGNNNFLQQLDDTVDSLNYRGLRQTERMAALRVVLNEFVIEMGRLRDSEVFGKHMPHPRWWLMGGSNIGAWCNCGESMPWDEDYDVNHR